MAITQDQTNYYERLNEMFGTEGWKELVEHAKAEIYQLQADSLDAKNWDIVCYLKGKAEQLAYFVSLEEISDMQRTLLEADPEEEDNDIYVD